jgi:hypothetical protein
LLYEFLAAAEAEDATGNALGDDNAIKRLDRALGRDG